MTEDPRQSAPPSDQRRRQLQRLYDAALVLRFQTGDDAAFEEIVVQLHDRLRRYITNSFTLPASDIDDLMQDVWLDACRDLRRLRKPDSLRSWLYRVARNKALKQLHRRPRAARLDSIPTPPVPPQTPTPAIPRAEFQQALSTLSPAHREVVLLRFEEGLTYDEISAAVQCPVGTVRSRLHHAKALLQQKLRSFAHDD